jgi:UDP-N-acetylmuramate dehydrogenase
MPNPSPFAGFEHAVQERVALAPLTWYNLGGPARYLVQPKDPDELRVLSRRCVENGIRVLVLGMGANLLVADEGVEAAVFRLNAKHFEEFSASGTTVCAGAGADMQVVARYCVRHGLSGLQCMAGIPGTIGGCVRGNAGGKYGDIGASVSRVTVMSLDGEIFDRTRDDLLFTYRKSNIAATFVLGAKFDLEEDSPEELVRRFKEIWMFKKNTQPLNTKNAGCTFKNPQYAAGMPGPSAGVLIEQAGLKGYRIGLAEVSAKHANFIVAHPGCTATEIMRLIDHVQETVLKVHGIALEQEVVIWK